MPPRCHQETTWLFINCSVISLDSKGNQLRDSKQCSDHHENFDQISRWKALQYIERFIECRSLLLSKILESMIYCNT